MKRIIALFGAAVLFVLMFTSCKKEVVVDSHGVTHTLVMKHGDPVQDEYGNMIEKYKDENGKNVTAPFSFPDVTKAGKNAIQNAVIKMSIPKSWEFDESINSFRIKHKNCKNEAKCELFVEIQDRKTLEEEYKRKLAAQEVVNLVGGDDGIVTDIKESTTKIFGLETKSFKSDHQGDMTYYYYVFYYKNNTVGFSFVMNNKCFDKNFDPEAFIKENVSLKTIPTE